ncbi:MAG: sulfite exporter TauE/SafE family protein [Bradyrhizobiaceae bacterium]|nr:sulfite exporter TauE/SafE family protein [Bradyrhizobiaceae bacterium]
MAIGSVILAFAAGVLSILSPCVLPILPIVLSTAASGRKWGPAALAAGLVLSFVIVGLLAATIGYAIGFDADLFRAIAAALLIAFGAVLTLPPLQAQLAVASGPIANWADRRLGSLSKSGLLGQFSVGVLLGAVWSPCVGPTLGAASLLAAQGRDLVHVGIIMLAFGVGAALPLLALGLISRAALQRKRGQLLLAGSGLKFGLGLLLVVIGALVLTGLDKTIETVLVDASPQWLTDLTTRL